ncbi:MAG: hypothetical protein C0480_01500 [Bradyrhizobium sp.]|nr:hypothetical protein [Bradyrhizobium sp.]
MSLAPIKLDDLDWRAMVDGIRRRIPAASSGDWTLHSPVDPGVTLLELYAWLIEQRIFWVDQVPDTMVRASLRLLGVRQQGARPARTLLRVSVPGSAPGAFLVPRHGEFLLDDSRPDIRFTTTHAAQGLAVDDVAVSTLHRGRTRQLDSTRALPLFGTDGAPAEVRFDLHLRAAPPANFAAPFGVLLDLDVAPGIHPAWHSSEARRAPPPQRLRWWYSTAAGRRELDAGQLVDDTLGLRRPGLLRFRPPEAARWAEREAGSSIYSLWATVESCAFVYSPRLLRVVPNVVVAEHRRPVTSGPMNAGLLPLPSRELPLLVGARRNHDGDGPLGKQSRLHLRERDGSWRRWRATDDFTFHRSDARVFVINRERQLLEFGNGYQGRVPALAAGHNVKWRFWMGGGRRGNVGSGHTWTMNSAAPPWPCATARNVVPGIGGADAESIDAARTRARAWTRRVTRAVTAADFEELARATPGVDVARAHAAVGVHPRHACPVADAVSVFIVPWAPRGDLLPTDEFVATPVADVGMLAAVRKRLGRSRLLGTQVFVRAAQFRAVDLLVEVSGERSEAAAVQAVLFGALREFLDPLTGGDGDPATGWEFGVPLRPSMLLRRAQQALSPGLTVTRMTISFDGADEEDCGDVSPGPHALPWLRALTATLTPAAFSGGLR